MGGRLGGGRLLESLTRPHRGGLEDAPRLASAIAGALLIGSGLLHVSAAGDHTNLPVMAAGFLVVATLQAGLGGLLLLRRPARPLALAATALTLGALGAWLLSRTAGLPFLPGGHMEPIGFKDGVTVLFEMATVPLLVLLTSAELDRVRLPSPRLGSQAVALVGSGMFALFMPAFVLGGGEHHSAAEMARHAHGDEEVASAGDHAHGDELADASTGHFDHHDGAGSGHAEGGHGEEGDHAHGRRATAAVLADAHPSGGGHDRHGTGHGHDGGSGGGSTGGGHDHRAGGNDRASGDHDHATRGEDRASGDHDPADHGHARGQRDGHRDGGDHGNAHAHGDGGGDTGSAAHAGDGHGTGEHGGSGERSIALESGHAGGDGRRPRGPAIVMHDQPDEELNGRGHAHGAPCEPTAEQQAAADAIVVDVRAELRRYENNPAAAIADGFDYVFGPTDRMLHMVHLRRVNDPDVLKASEIESFIYYMTDTGWVPIAGMFVMPRYGISGPEPGGCLTQWHHHGGIVGRWATAGTSANTPEMMHVFTYPGLDPWGHYNGRDLASLWTPGRWIPSVCRESGDANDGCLP